MSAIKMTRSVLMSPLGSEFDDFLYASIDEDRNGVLMSVLSALARLDLDPWEEAGRLALLPQVTATRNLTSLIAALPARIGRPDAETIAPRLIALLPCREESHDPSRQALGGIETATRPSAFAFAIRWILLIGLLSAVLWLLPSVQAPAPIDKTPASVSGPVHSLLSPPSSGFDE